MVQDFLTTQEGELCAVAGDILQVESGPVERYWLECRLDTRRGRVSPPARSTPH